MSWKKSSFLDYVFNSFVINYSAEDITILHNIYFNWVIWMQMAESQFNQKQTNELCAYLTEKDGSKDDL